MNAKYVLDTIIKEYSDFEDLVLDCLDKFKIGDQKTITEILGKHIRRINSNLQDLEKSLINKIKNSNFDYLRIVLENANPIYSIEKHKDLLPF
ncbi:hypothetical protein A9P82_05745 [Arachidicoccus ginsenosidimutans]|nr:hypothetical protein A9P82_05745 [Arachidicoccus sp. BS20]